MPFVICAVILFCLWLALRWLDTQRTERFKADYPPITEDEFMARCDPGTPRETALKVRQIVSEQLDVPYESVYPEHRLVEDLGAE